MSESWRIQISPKAGNTLINLRAETPEEMLTFLAWAETNAPAIVKAVTALEMLGQAPAVAEMGTQAQGQLSPQNRETVDRALAYQPQQQAPAQQPAGPSPSCRHGAMNYKEGQSKAGKAYKGWFCSSTNRNDSCSPQWA